MDRRKNSRPCVHRFRAMAHCDCRTAATADLAFSRERSAKSRAGAHRTHVDEPFGRLAARFAARPRSQTQPQRRSRETAAAERRGRISSAADNPLAARCRHAPAANINPARRAANSAKDRSPASKYRRMGRSQNAREASAARRIHGRRAASATSRRQRPRRARTREPGKNAGPSGHRRFADHQSATAYAG